MTSLLPGILATSLLFAGLYARAQNIPFLDLTVSPGTQTTAPGTSLFWNVQLTNNNADTAYFIFLGFNDGLGSVPNIVVPAYDPTPFGQQFALNPNASLNLLNLFQTVVSPMSGNSTYVSNAEATYDLYDSSQFSNLLLSDVTASGGWTLNVLAAPSAVPEPGTIALFVVAGVTGTGIVLRRRKKS